MLQVALSHVFEFFLDVAEGLFKLRLLGLDELKGLDGGLHLLFELFSFLIGYGCTEALFRFLNLVRGTGL